MSKTYGSLISIGMRTWKYAAAKIHAAIVTNPKMPAKMMLIMQVKMKKVNSANPHTIK